MRLYLTLRHYLRRHIWAALPYITVRKIFNLCLSRIELHFAVITPLSTPVYIKIEATPLCHLSCDGCPHRSKAYKKKLSAGMQLSCESIAKIVDTISQNLVGASLSYSGEPMLNRRLPEIISYLHKKNICTSFASNMSVPMTDAAVEAYVNSGLDFILVSLDGMTPESYVKYRKGGNFALVLENVKKFGDQRRRLQTSRPLLVLKMVVFPHNKHEVAMATKVYKSLGFDSIEFDLDHASIEAVQATQQNNEYLVSHRRACFWPWTAPTVGWDGEVQPCCKQMNQIALGNAAEQDILKIWRGENFARLRSGFQAGDYGKGLHPICRKCLGLEPSLCEANAE
jgi:MoaA/NifB/PqqE/SkfB family radical SAM enzyme